MYYPDGKKIKKKSTNNQRSYANALQDKRQGINSFALFIHALTYLYMKLILATEGMIFCYNPRCCPLIPDTANNLTRNRASMRALFECMQIYVWALGVHL